MRLGVRDQTHALFARNVQCRVTNRVTEMRAVPSALDYPRNRAVRAISMMHPPINVRARTPMTPETMPELHSHCAAAQTRTASATASLSRGQIMI